MAPDTPFRRTILTHTLLPQLPHWCCPKATATARTKAKAEAKAKAKAKASGA